MASKFGSKAKALVAGLIIVSVVLGIAGVGLMNGSAVVNASKELAISDVKLTSIYIDRRSGALQLRASVTISNPSTMGIELRNAKYVMSLYRTISLNASGPATIMIPAQSSRTVEVTALLKPSSNGSLKAIKNAFTTKEVDVGVGIAAEVPVKWFNLAQYSVTTVELGGHTTQDIGPLLSMVKGTMATRSEFTVTNVKWYVNNHRATRVRVGDKVTVKFTLKANMDTNDIIGTCIILDKAYADDECVEGKNISVSLRKGEEKEITLRYKVLHDQSNYRGYYLIVGHFVRDVTRVEGYPVIIRYVIDDDIYSMPNNYPPRLKQIHEHPHVIVVNTGWYVNDKKVTSVHKGTWVDAKITLKALTRSHAVKVEFCVRRDYKYWFDKDEKCITTTVNLDKGETKTLTIHFQANHHTWLKGYFMKVKIWEWSKHTWQMPSHYPPRLKVS